jgi:hypothetical protein
MPNIIDLINEVDDQDGIKEPARKPGQQSFVDARIVKIDVPFSDLVSLLVKLSIAAVPAAVIVFFLWTILTIIFGVGVGAMFRSFIR